MTTIVSGKPESYVQIPVSDATDGTIAALHIVLNHTADVFRGVVDAIAEHYGLDKDEMMSVIQKHPKYTGILQNPVLEDLGYLHKNKAVVKRSYKKKVIPVVPVEPVVPVVPVEPVVPVVPPPEEPKKFKINKKKSAV
jgi:hypothetical protein